jgi:hypothetical protein
MPNDKEYADDRPRVLSADSLRRFELAQQRAHRGRRPHTARTRLRGQLAEYQAKLDAAMGKLPTDRSEVFFGKE